jgi:membrane-bound ClpP family serine protease
MPALPTIPIPEANALAALEHCFSMTSMLTVLTLILVGAALLLLETILPGFVAGTLGVICIIAGVTVAYVNFGAGTGNLVLLAVLAGLIVGTWFWLKYFPDSRVARVFVSHRVVGELNVEKPELLDQVGVAQTNLRPSGMALIDGKRVDVVTEGPMIARGTNVKVVAVEGMRVVVRAV